MKRIPACYAACIGLDWADQKHDVCLKETVGEALEYDQIKHSPEAIDDWALGLQRRFQDQPIAICLELSSGPIVSALLKYHFITLFPVSPKALAKYRPAFTQSGAKDDPTDAFLQLDYLLKHPDALKPLSPDSAATRILQRLVEDRRHFVADKVRLTNRLTAALKAYYPQVLQWFDDIDTQQFCDFIQSWPTLKQALRAQASTLSAFFRSHGSGRPALIEKRLSAIRSTLPLTEDEGVIVSYATLARALAAQLSQLLSTIHSYDQQIAQRFDQHQESGLFASFPGAGAVFGPRLLAAFGTNRERFESANEVCRVSGVAPVMERSGNYTWVHWRYACPKFLRQTFVEWANVSKRYSYWAKEFYDKKRAEGKTHQATLRALAFKWIRIIFRCWKDRVPYDESAYLFALKKRQVVTG
ncbi:MAG: IS110 family transposase [Gammaproteobacteria bacterium]|nr:IS110 family transposase [Gammaproteobacteria bacterium]